MYNSSTRWPGGRRGVAAREVGRVASRLFSPSDSSGDRRFASLRFASRASGPARPDSDYADHQLAVRFVSRVSGGGRFATFRSAKRAGRVWSDALRSAFSCPPPPRADRAQAPTVRTMVGGPPGPGMFRLLQLRTTITSTITIITIITIIITTTINITYYYY